MLLPQDSSYTSFHKLVGGVCNQQFSAPNEHRTGETDACIHKDMDTVPLLGDNFNKFSPILIVFFAVASLFNAGWLCRPLVAIARFRFPLDDD